MAFDAYVKIDGILGEAQDGQCPGWIEITGYSFGAAQSASMTASRAAGAALGRAKIHDFVFTKLTDKATSKLFEACCSGRHLKTVTLAVFRSGAGKVKYLELTLEEVIVSDFTHLGSTGEPTEEVHLNFGRIKTTYTQQKRSDGTGGGIIAGGWDRIANKAFA